MFFFRKNAKLIDPKRLNCAVLETRDESDEDSYFSAKVEGFWTTVCKRFVRHWYGVAGLIVLMLLVLCAIAAPLLTPYGYDEINFAAAPMGQPQPPSEEHLFGTDYLGRDYLTRCLFGGRVSLLVGFGAVIIELIIGIPLGCAAGYYRGALDSVICRFIDVFSCIPSTFLILLVNALLSPNIFNVIFVLGVFGWTGYTRFVRSYFLSLREQEFVQAAKASGLKERVIVFRHILPHALTPLILSVSMGIGGAILAESGLSYLGLGVQEPTPSWGAMISNAQEYVNSAPWLSVFPGLLITLTVLSLCLIGEAFRQAIDPRSN